MGIAEVACISSLTVTTSLVKSARSNVLNSALMAMATISSRLSQFQSWSWNAWLRLKACPCCSGVGCWGCKAKCKSRWISVRYYSIIIISSLNLIKTLPSYEVKFMYSEKITIFFEIFPLLLTTVYTVKSKRKISQNFVAFSEYMNFKFISHANIRTLLKLQKCKGRLKHVFISSCTLSICTWFLKNRVWNLFSKIKLVEVDFLFISNLIFTACVACKNQV